MASFDKSSPIAGIIGNLILAAVFVYDAVSSMGQSYHLYPIVFKFSAAGFFAAKMVIAIIEYTTKKELAWKYIAYIALSIYMLIAFIVTLAVSCHYREGCPWYYLLIGIVFCVFMVSEALKYRREYIAKRSSGRK